MAARKRPNPLPSPEAIDEGAPKLAIASNDTPGNGSIRDFSRHFSQTAVESCHVVPGVQQHEFVDFYAREAVSVVRYARTILGPRDMADVEDAVQDAWTKAWRAWESADPQRRTAWMFRIVRNCCLNSRRDRGSASLCRVDLPSGTLGDEQAAAEHGDDRLVQYVEATSAVLLLDGLSQPLREALYLRVIEERSYSEIAAILGIPIGTVMSRLHAGRRALVRRMGPR